MQKHERSAIKSAKKMGFVVEDFFFTGRTHGIVYLNYEGNHCHIIIPSSPKNKDDSISSTRRNLLKLQKQMQKRRTG